MAEATLTFDDIEVKRFIQKLVDSMRDVSGELRTAFNTAGFKDIIDHFQKEEGPDGAWQPRSEMTKQIYDLIASGRRKAPQGVASGAFSSNNKLLQLTGNLRKSIMPSNVKTINKHSIMAFSPIVYSNIHDQGGKTRFGTIPARPFMWLSDDAMETMAQIFLTLVIDKADK